MEREDEANAEGLSNAVHGLDRKIVLYSFQDLDPLSQVFNSHHPPSLEQSSNHASPPALRGSRVRRHSRNWRRSTRQSPHDYIS